MRRVVAFAPGRVNLIGEHTDYNQGLALPFAIQQGVTVTAAQLSRPWIEAVAADLGERDSFPLEDCSPADGWRRSSANGWRAFVRGTVAELQRAGLRLAGARLYITGTLPMGSGLGSSAALEVALALALSALAGGSEPDRLELARLCSRVENEWVGAHTGLLDQLACLAGLDGHALLIDFRSLEVSPVPVELGDWHLMLLDSGESHTNAISEYNQRREECARACRLLGVASLRDATLGDADRLPAPLDRRVRHVVSANQRVSEAVESLRRRDLKALGDLLDACHTSLRDLYEVSTPAVDDAVRRFKQAGAAGARLIGGGFGGQVLGLMPPDADNCAEALAVHPRAGARVVREASFRASWRE